MDPAHIPRQIASKPANQKYVALGVLAFMGIAAVPLMFKEIRRREQTVAEMRDSAYDTKDDARNDRLRVKPRSQV